mgnify:FL=1
MTNRLHARFLELLRIPGPSGKEERVAEYLVNVLTPLGFACRRDEHGNLSLHAGGTIVEYAVKMFQLPEDSNFAVMLREGRVTQEQISALGRILAAFHARAEAGPHIDAFGDPQLIRSNMEENFEQIQPFVENRIDREKWEFICRICLAFWEDHWALFQHRLRSGKIRDGHGDLRTDHIYFHHGIQIIDCIEFNQRFRFGDTALDLAFLMMDLDHLGHSRIAQTLLQVYATTSHDPEIYALLEFYAAYRALVRLKVACFSLDQAEPARQGPLLKEISLYLLQAYQYALCFGRPVLWVFFGLPASGKSTLARLVTQALFMPLLQSNMVRKQDQDFPLATVVPFNTGQYRLTMRNRVYAKLFNMAQEQLKKGKSVALDATFSDSAWRREAVRLARDHNAGLIFVQCTCDPETIRARLAQRDKAPGASDARLIHFADMLKHHEPFTEEMEDTLVVADTDQAVDQTMYEILSKAHALKRAQVATLLRGLNGTRET